MTRLLTLFFVPFLAFQSVAGAQNIAITNPPTPDITKLKARIGWTGNALDSVARRHAYEELLLVGYAVDSYRQNPNLEPSESLKLLNHVDDFYRSQHDRTVNGARVPDNAVEGIQASFDLLGDALGPGDKAFVAVGKDVFKLGVYGYQALVQDSSRVEAQLFESSNEDLAWSLGSRYLNQATALAEENPKFRVVLDSFFGSEHRFNALSSDSYDTILRKNPDFASANKLDSLVETQRGLEVNVDKLRSEFGDTTNALLNSVRDNTALVSQIDKSQRALYSYLRYKDAQAKAHALQLEERDNLINGSRASIYMLSTLASLVGNPRLAAQISTAGNAAVQVAEAANRYANASANLSSLGKAGSSAMLMASCVGAALAVANMFSSDESPDQAIMAEIAALSRQIAQLTIDMHARFDRIEQTLAVGFANIADDFRELAILETKNLAEISEARRDIAAIRVGLDNLTYRLIALRLQEDEELRAGFDRDFQQQLASCLGHDTYITSSKLSLAQFQQCQLYFTVYGAVTSKDALSTGGAVSGIDDEFVISKLRQESAVRALPLLVDVASQKFSYQHLVGTVDRTIDISSWSRGANAYMAVAEAYPDFSKETPSKGLDELIESGEGAVAVIQRFREARFLIAVLENYRVAFEQWKTLVANLETQYRGQYAHGYDLWKGPHQPTSYKARSISQTSIHSCSTRQNPEGWISPNLDLPMPGNLDSVVPSDLLMAEDLNLGSVNVCFMIRDFSVANSATEDFPYIQAFGGTRWARHHRVRPSVRVVLDFSLKGIEKPLPIGEVVAEGPNPVDWAWKDLGTNHSPDGALKGPDYANKRTTTLEPIRADVFIAANWSSGLNLQKLIADLVRGSKPDEHTTKQVTDVVKKYLDLAGEDFCLKLSGKQLDPAELVQAGNTLDSAKGLLYAYIGISMSGELTRSDVLREALFGKESTMDSNQLLQAYRLEVDNGSMDQWRAQSQLALDGISVSRSSLDEAIASKNPKRVRQLVSAGVFDVVDKSSVSDLLEQMKRMHIDPKNQLASFPRSGLASISVISPAYHPFIEATLRQQDVAMLAIRSQIERLGAESDKALSTVVVLTPTLDQLKRLQRLQNESAHQTSQPGPTN